jgi:hypothetical protein
MGIRKSTSDWTMEEAADEGVRLRRPREHYWWRRIKKREKGRRCKDKAL